MLTAMDQETFLLHQVHPAKLATDITADIVSTWLMWRGRPWLALLLANGPAIVATAVVTRQDLTPLKETKRGQYVLKHMPPAAQAVRYGGQVLAWYAAYKRRPVGIAIGHLAIIAGWSYGAVSPGAPGRSARASSTTPTP
jgi:hypothetical protein